MSNTECRLTTIDNPYDPFTQFDDWFVYDVGKGYNTCGLLARVSNTSSDLTDEEYNEEVERAIDEIVKNDFQDIYIKVKKQPSNKNKNNPS